MSKSLDLINKRFGKLVIKKRLNKQGTSWTWLCECDCGNRVIVRTSNLNNKSAQSCGCLRLEKSKQNLSGDIALKLGQIEGTNVSKISSDKPQQNNTSGVRGVSLHRQKGKSDTWIAYIGFKGSRYYLGSYFDKEDAIAARKNAEKNLYGNFLKWYKQEFGENDEY